MAMKRFNFMLEPDLELALARRAHAEGISKGAVIRRLLRKELAPLEEDPLWAWVSGGTGGSRDDSLRVNEVVYGLDRDR
jgi:hypothetical protein